MKKFIIGALIIGVAIVVGFIVKNKAVPYGGSPGPDHYNMEYFHAGMTDGGEMTTLTAGGTVSITAAQACNSSILSFAASAVGSSTTLPTAASMTNQCLRTNGESKTLIFRNTGLAASTTVIKVSSTTAETLLVPETTGADVIIDGQNWASIKFIRTSASAITIVVKEFIAGD